MKIISDAHLHTHFCDGCNSPQEMADRALELGFTGLGFSAHSPAVFDDTCPGILGVEKEYQAAIAALKQEYAGRLDILCGVEQDFRAPITREEYDYIIGSVHYLPDTEGNLVAVDGTPQHLQAMIQRMFHGNGPAFYQAFYAETAENVRKYHPEIVGHFDLVVKHNQKGNMFQEDSDAYRAAALRAMDDVLEETLSYGGIIEINTGGVARGYRMEPYPALFLLRHIAQRDGRVMLTSDSHSVQSLGFGFEQALELVKKAGIKRLCMIKDKQFEEVEIDFNH